MHMQSTPVKDPAWTQFVNQLPPLDLHQGPWIAGGSARKLYMGQDWSAGDVDVFFRSKEHMWEWQKAFEQKFMPKKRKVADLWDCIIQDSKRWLTSDHAEHIPNPQFQAHKHLETENAVTYHLYTPDDKIRYTIQLIKARYNESLERLWNDFDFTVCCFAADATEIKHTVDALTHVNENRLVVQTVTHLTNMPLRVLKHMIYGFEPDAKLLKQIGDQILAGDVSWQPEY